jgi:hypothetical protein
MRVRKQMRVCIPLLVGLSPMVLAYKGANTARLGLEMTLKAYPQTAAQAPPIPPAGPLADPKSLKQIECR